MTANLGEQNTTDNKYNPEFLKAIAFHTLISSPLEVSLRLLTGSKLTSDVTFDQLKRYINLTKKTPVCKDFFFFEGQEANFCTCKPDLYSPLRSENRDFSPAQDGWPARRKCGRCPLHTPVEIAEWHFTPLEILQRGNNTIRTPLEVTDPLLTGRKAKFLTGVRSSSFSLLFCVFFAVSSRRALSFASSTWRRPAPVPLPAPGVAC